MHKNALPRYASAMVAKKPETLVFLIVLFVIPALSAQQTPAQTPLAQVTTAPVSITTVDESGAVVRHALVQLTPAPDLTQKMETDEKGRLALNLQPGGYDLSVQMPGFKKFATRIRVVESTQVQTILVVLQVDRGGVDAATAAASANDVLVLWTYPYYDAIRLSVSEFKALPHIKVSIHNTHNDADETYSGVRLADLLAKMGAPFGNELRGGALASYVVATGSDGYKAVLALAEVDPSFHPGEVIVADAMNGKPLDEHSGPFKLVVTEDKRPARSVRNLINIELTAAN